MPPPARSSHRSCARCNAGSASRRAARTRGSPPPTWRPTTPKPASSKARATTRRWRSRPSCGSGFARSWSEASAEAVARGHPLAAGLPRSHAQREAVARGRLAAHRRPRAPGRGQLHLGDGRAKDLIIRSGHNIDPRVIEDTLMAREPVALAAAVGKPDAYAGELPIAFVQLKPGMASTPEELQGFVRDRIPERAAAPSQIFIVPAMPLTAVGKIFKPELRNRAARDVY